MTAPDPSLTTETLLAHREWVRALARSLVRDESRAEDVEQETWLAAIERPPTTGAALGGWLRKVVRSRAIDAHRSETRRVTREAVSARPESTSTTDELVAQAEIQRDVAAAVCALEEPYRTAVLLRYFEELEPREIAARLGVPVETVRTRLKRAHEQLRARLDGEYGDRRAWCVLLVPLARRGKAVPVGATAAGALLMAGKAKLFAAAALALLLLGGGAAWMAMRDADEPRESSGALVAEPRAETASVAEDTAGMKFRVTGRVRSAADGRPVPSALVVMAGEKGKRVASAESSADGAFAADGVSARSVRVEAAGFCAFAADVPPPADGVADVGDVWLASAAALVVEVVGPAGAPVEDAEVTLVRTGEYGEVATTNSYLRGLVDPDFRVVRLGAKRTDVAGLARFAEIAAGSHSISVRANGLTAASAWVTVRPGRAETRQTVRLTAGVRLTGRLVTAAGVPAVGWLVWTGGPTWDERSFATTDTAGRFAFDALTAGEVQLGAGRRRGDLPTLATVRVPEITDVELKLPPMGTVVGRVHLADGNAVADAEVGVETTIAHPQRAGFYAHTDADGRFRIDDVPAGPITRFEVRHARLYEKKVEGPSIVDAAGETSRDVTMGPGARLHGRVLSSDGPVGGAWIYLHLTPNRAGQQWETTTADSAGRWSFDYLRPGKAGVVPLHGGYFHPEAPPVLGDALRAGTLAAALTIDLPEGGDVERDLFVVPGARIAGRVLGPNGEPVTGAVVGAAVDAGVPGSYNRSPYCDDVTDADGVFVLERVAGPGTATLRAEADGLSETGSPALKVEPGGRIDGVELRMAAQPTVTGRVTDAAGAPVAGARVTLDVPDKTARVSPVVVWTDADGAYRARAPRAQGKAVIAANAEGRGDGRIEVDLAGDVAGKDIVLADSGVLTGRVLLDGVAPVAGARIGVYEASAKRWFIHGDLSVGGRTVTASTAKTDTVADAEGRFRLTLPPGEHLLFVRGTDAVEEAVVVRAPSAGEVVVSMSRAATLSGTLRGDDGRPLVHASVVLEPGPDLASERFAGRGVDFGETDAADGLLARHTDAEGAFAFPGIPESDYTLVVLRKDASTRKAVHTRFGPLRPSRGPFDLSLAAPLTGSIAGRVADRDGSPYRDAKIQVSAALEWTPSMWGPPMGRDAPLVDVAADGSFRIEGLTGQRYTVHAWVWTEPQERRLPDGSVSYAKFRRRSFRGVRPGAPDVVLAMTDGLTIRGRLVDDAGAPIANAMVQAEAPGYDRTILTQGGACDATGAFVIRDVDDVEYALRSYNKPQRRLVLPGLVRGGAELGDVVATLGGRIRGHVVDTSGAPVAGSKHWKVTVVATTGGAVQEIVADAQGAFEATGLEPGKDQRICIVTDDPKSRASFDAGVVVPVGTEDVKIVAK